LKPSTVCTLLLGAISFAPAQAPHNKIQALIITGQNGHDWRATTPVLRKALDENGRLAPLREQMRRDKTMRHLLGELHAAHAGDVAEPDAAAGAATVTDTAPEHP